MTGILSPAVPASRSALVNTGVTGTSAAAGIVVAIGHLRGGGLEDYFTTATADSEWRSLFGVIDRVICLPTGAF